MKNRVYSCTVRTKHEIQKAFISAIETKDFSSIKISDITTIAKIPRTTFYDYYANIYDIYQDCQKEFLKRLAKQVRNKDIHTLHDLDCFAVEYAVKHKALFPMIFSENDLNAIPQKACRLFAEMLLDDDDSDLQDAMNEYTEYLTYYHISGIIAILYHWFQSDMTMSEDHLKDLCSKIEKNNSSILPKDTHSEK